MPEVQDTPEGHEVPLTTLAWCRPVPASDLSPRLASPSKGSPRACSPKLEDSRSPCSNTSSLGSGNLDSSIAVQWAQEAERCLFAASGHKAERCQFLESGGLAFIVAALHPQAGCRGLARAKFVAALAKLAAIHLDYIEYAADEGVDFFEELCRAFLTTTRYLEAVRAGLPNAPLPTEVFALCTRLYEACVALTRHAVFKESLLESEGLLKAIQGLLSKDDLAEDHYLAFLYTIFLYNLCRSNEDIAGAEAGCDPGSASVAEGFRNWCVPRRSSSTVVLHLAQCALTGSTCVMCVVAFVLHFLCASEGRWPELAACGGVEVLLGLVNLEDKYARDAAREALAHLCVAARPDYLRSRVRVLAVTPLVEMLHDNRPEFVRDGARGLTQLLSAQGWEERSVALHAGAWQICCQLTTSTLLDLRRAATEALCNLSQAPEMIELFCNGGADHYVDTFFELTKTEDRDTRRAASGALAMLAQHPEAARHIARSPGFFKMKGLMELAESHGWAEIDHRCIAFYCGLCRATGVSRTARTKCYEALVARRKAPMSVEAQMLLNDLYADEALLARLKENPATKTAGVPPRPPRPPSAEGRLQAKENRDPAKSASPRQNRKASMQEQCGNRQQKRGLSVDHIAETLLQRLGKEDRKREQQFAQVRSVLDNQCRLNKALHERALNHCSPDLAATGGA
mmetsp:Transcript_22086/g.50489  ORF Transcript_22086/g.50489 Transcript_22086/m.50489 type:complete len:685 (+) Transcript_22086:126-2180(+)